MRIQQLIAGTLLAVCRPACGRPERAQEDVTLPGEGPTYRNDSSAAPAVTTAPGDTSAPAATADSATGRPTSP